MAGLREALRILARASAPRQGEMNALRMFAGPLAKTADHQALSRAQEMAGQGATRDAIWRDTGWFQGVDGKWRFEIDDSGARVALPPEPPGMIELANQYARDNFGVRSMIDMPVNDPRRLEAIKYGQANAPTVETLRAQRYRLGDVLDHPELYDAYPEAADIQVGREMAQGVHGSFAPTSRVMRLRDESPILGVPHDTRATALHETQHGVPQEAENFMRGGDPANVYDAQGRDLTARINENIRQQDTLRSIINGRNTGVDVEQYREQLGQLTREYAELNSARRDLLAPGNRMDGYRRLGGEVEARNVETRRDFTPEERRSRPPWETQDVPDDQQIVRFDGDKASNALGDILRASAGLGGVALAGDITLRELLREQRTRRTQTPRSKTQAIT